MDFALLLMNLSTVQRPIPPGLSLRDQTLLKKVRKRARCLDKGMGCCGMRWGWGAIIGDESPPLVSLVPHSFYTGIVPEIGDAMDACLAYWLIIRLAYKAECDPRIIAQMVCNNTVASLWALIPLFGTSFYGGVTYNLPNRLRANLE